MPNRFLILTLLVSTLTPFSIPDASALSVASEIYYTWGKNEGGISVHKTPEAACDSVWAGSPYQYDAAESSCCFTDWSGKKWCEGGVSTVLRCPPDGSTSPLSDGTCSVQPPPQKDNGPPDVCAGNPLNVGTGNKYQPETDLSPSGTSPLHFSRFYNSTPTTQTTDLGSQWTHNYSAIITPQSVDGSWVTMLRPEGRLFNFVNVDGQWKSEGDITDILEPLSDLTGQPAGWQYTIAKDQTIETYDTQGRLLSITGSDGSHQTLTYTDGLLAHIQDQNGRTLQIDHDAAGRIVSLTDPLGQITTYTYTADGLLSAVQYPDHTGRQYHYNETGFINNGEMCSGRPAGLPTALTGITDQNNTRYATFTYNCAGQATGSSHPDGIDQVKLLITPSLVYVTDPLGSVRTYSFKTIHGVKRRTTASQPAGSGCGASTATFDYDENGNITARTDFNNTRTCSAFDLTRNLETVRIEGLTSTCPSNLNTAAVATGQRKITTEWHPHWSLITQRAAPNRIITSVYNGQPDPSNSNAILTCAPASAILPNGQPLAVLCKQIEQPTSDTDGSKGFSAAPVGKPRITQWTYDVNGKMLTERAPDGQTLTYTYASATTSTHTLGDRLTVTDTTGRTTTYTAYDRAGRLLESRDPNGVVTRLTYDTRGQLTEHTRAGHTTRYTYTPVGQLHTLTDPDGNTLTHTYDAAHRLTAITDSLGNRIAYTYDAAGNLTRETHADPANTLIRAQTRYYDALQRVQRTIQGE